MSYRVRFTEEAEEDLVRLYQYILDRDETDGPLAARALAAIRQGIHGLGQSPFSYRKANAGSPWLRELVIPFGATGYVALFEIEDASTVTVLAIRHQREDDFH